MPRNKILVICPLHDAVSQKYSHQLEHRSVLSQADVIKWRQAIERTTPKVIIFNTENFTREMMQLWRSCLPTESLSIARGGTSLSKCDLEAAKFYNIQVFNTPGVNSKYVANYINGIIFHPSLPIDRIAIIGVGNIGSRIAIAATERRRDFILYNKTKKSNLLHISDEKLAFAPDLETAITQANKIAVSLPLNASTRGIITTKMIEKIPKNSVLVCVSPFEVFTDDALRALYHRKDVHVIFDDIQAELRRIHEVIGNSTPLRDFFILETKAAASQECQNAMVSAAIEKGISLNVAQETAAPSNQAIRSHL